MSDDPLASFPQYVRAVGERLEAGAVAYGNKSFSRDPNSLLIELQQEAEDCAGWGFVLWHRLGAMRASLAPRPPKEISDGVSEIPPPMPAETCNRPDTGFVATAAPRGAPAEAGRMVLVPRPGRVFVLPLLRQPDLTFAIGEPVELSRVPVARELLELPGLGTHRVMVVRHTPGAPGDAEVYLEPAPTTSYPVAFDSQSMSATVKR